MYFQTHKKEDCCGCSACMNACPVSAIIMVEDEEGFLYPQIDENTCIHCNLCQKVCCWENPKYENNENPLTLASVLKDKNERQQSTSGGIFYLIARWVIENNGVVYGAAFDNNLQLHHIAAQTIDELQKLRGSKYIQSCLGDIFKDVKTQLEEQRLCFFSGTGCQVAGLKAFLRKDYEKLITADLVCHGVPSQKLFNLHVSYMENKYRDKVTGYQFRDYKKGDGCEICSFKNRKKVVKPTYDLSPYLSGFMYGFVNRYSCYDCRFAKVPRQGDITLADYWGVEKFVPQIDRDNGVSLLLINSDKGKKVWNSVNNDSVYYESDINRASENNDNLIRSSIMPPLRNRVYKEIEERGYKYVAETLFRSPHYIRTKVFLFVSNNPLTRPLLLLYKYIKKQISKVH